MLAYTAKRLALLLPLALGMVLVTFALLQLVPGDPAAVLLGQDATPRAVAEMREKLGLDVSLPRQLARYVSRLCRGDLGESIFRNEPVGAAIAARLPATLELALAALLFSVAVGTAGGVWTALRAGTWIDALGLLLAQVGASVPVFWLGILLTLWLAVSWNLFPALGRGGLSHLVLPAITLGTNGAAVVSRLVRAAILERLGEAFVVAAAARGLSRWQVLVGHALRSALLPVVSALGVRFGQLLAGAVLTEAVFGWPGLGQLAVTALSQRDFPLVQGVVLVFALLFALVNLGVDLLYGLLDPRIRAGGVRRG